jgi:hypothetical protein
MLVTLVAEPKRPYALMVSAERELTDLPGKGEEMRIAELDRTVRVYEVRSDNRVCFIVEAREVAFLRSKGWKDYERYD